MLFGAPGKLTISVRPRTPATPRETIHSRVCSRDAIDREAPGYAEAIRDHSRAHTPLGLLTRGVSGVRGRTLIVNLPGNPKAIEPSWPIVHPTLEHAAKQLERGS